MVRKKLLLPFAFFLLCTSVFSQKGGFGTYAFLDMTESARSAALGGSLIAVHDKDLDVALKNPSLLREEMGKSLVLNYINYFADINYGYVGYGFNVDSIGTFSTAIQYLNYGKFTRTDEAGNELGTFSAGDYALSVGYGRSYDSTITYGANLKFIYSSMEEYTSVGLATDLSVTYLSLDKSLALSMLVRNLGVQLKSYVKGQDYPLPLNVQVGISKKLKHAPIRAILLLDNLQKWDLTYKDPTEVKEVDLFGDEEPKQESKIGDFSDKLMRHIVPGFEFVFTENFNVRVAYHYRKRQELKLDEKPGASGVSAGLGLRVSKFNLSYGLACYHLSGASHHFTVTTKLSDFRKKNS